MFLHKIVVCCIRPGPEGVLTVLNCPTKNGVILMMSNATLINKKLEMTYMLGAIEYVHCVD